MLSHIILIPALMVRMRVLIDATGLPFRRLAGQGSEDGDGYFRACLIGAIPYVHLVF